MFKVPKRVARLGHRCQESASTGVRVGVLAFVKLIADESTDAD